MTSLSDLLAKARAATPGPWTSVWEEPATNAHGGGQRHVDGANGCITCDPTKADAAFIAACDPQTIIELVERVERLEAGLKEVRTIMERCWQVTPGAPLTEHALRLAHAVRHDHEEKCSVVEESLRRSRDENETLRAALREVCGLYPRAWTNEAARQNDWNRITELRKLAEGNAMSNDSGMIVAMAARIRELQSALKEACGIALDAAEEVYGTPHIWGPKWDRVADLAKLAEET
jgi:hypothetical protein